MGLGDSLIRNLDAVSSLSMLDGEDTLVGKAIEGESSAFGTLYDHYQPRIYRFVLIRVGRREEAEDLTHQAFLNAWKNIGNYKHRGLPFSSWLYRIARNLIIDFYRTAKNDLPLDDELNVITEDHRLLEKKLENEQLMAAIRTLKNEHQEVIILRFIEEYSIAETAAAMERSQGAVKLLQHRALHRLRLTLENHE